MAFTVVHQIAVVAGEVPLALSGGFAPVNEAACALLSNDELTVFERDAYGIGLNPAYPLAAHLRHAVEFFRVTLAIAFDEWPDQSVRPLPFYAFQACRHLDWAGCVLVEEASADGLPGAFLTWGVGMVHPRVACIRGFQVFQFDCFASGLTLVDRQVPRDPKQPGADVADRFP
jgi:hypothetical protein